MDRMRVMICDFTGQLPRARRLELETRLAGLVGDTPAIDTAEVEMERSRKAPAGWCRRVSVTLRADHRPVVRVTEEAPTLTAALERALVDTARERDELARDAAGAQTWTPH